MNTELLTKAEAALALERPAGDPLLGIYFDSLREIVEAQRDAIRHAINMNIVDVASRDDALAVLKALKKTPKQLEVMRKSAMEGAQAFIDSAKSLERSFARPFEDVTGHVENSIIAYNLKVERDAHAERERVRRDLDEKQRKEEALRREREAEEERKKLEEIQRLAEIQKKAEAESAKLKGKAKLMAENVARVEREKAEAQIEHERAEREAVQAKADSDAKAALDLAAAQAANDIHIANSQGKTKGLAKRWTYDVAEEDLVVRDLCEPAKGKIREAVNAGLRNANEDGTPNPRAAGLHIYQEAGAVGR